MRIKIIIGLVALSTGLAAGLAAFNYFLLKDQVFSDVKRKLMTMVFLSAQSIDQPALLTLTQKIKTSPLPLPEAEQIEDTDEYRRISDQLNQVRQSYPELVRYVYILVKTADPNTAFFVVDADVLSLRSDPQEDEEISHFNSVLEVESYPAIKEVFASNQVTVEDEFTFDHEMNLYSLSGYSPIIDDDGRMIAYLGIDVASKDAAAITRQSAQSLIYLTILILFVSLFVNAFIGRLLTKTIRLLDSIVQRFSQNDFTVRVPKLPNDEIGRLGVSLNSMADIIETWQKRINGLTKAYEKFVPQDYIKLLGKSDIVELNLGDFSLAQEMTVLFTDIRGFTALSESMSPYDNFAFINSFLKRMGPIVRKNGGIIDKYLGDAIMALYANETDAALKTAIEMFVELDTYNRYRRSQGFAPISIGCGIHFGNTMVGTIGEQERMEATVIGDSVDTASQLEGLTRQYGANIIISEPTFHRITDKTNYASRTLDKIISIDKTTAFSIIEIITGPDAELNEAKIQHRVAFEEAVTTFHRRQVKQAYRQFKQLSKLLPGDLAVQFHLRRCQRLIAKVEQQTTTK